jgi:hypothetical protein
LDWRSLPPQESTLWEDGGETDGARGEKYRDREGEEGTVSAGNQAFAYREIMDIKSAANYLGVSRSHLSHILAGKIPGVPAIPYVRAGRRALIRRSVIDRWILDQEHCQAQRA